MAECGKEGLRVDYPRCEHEVRGIVHGPGDTPGKLPFELLDKICELAPAQPTFLYPYPPEVSTLSRCNEQDPFVTNRFGLCIAGRERVNGFCELNDPEEQAPRFREQVARKDAGDVLLFPQRKPEGSA